MSETAIKIRVDLIYKVPSDLAESILDQDLGLFDLILEGYENWNHNPKEVRKLISAKVTHDTGTVEEMSEDYEV